MTGVPVREEIWIHRETPEASVPRGEPSEEAGGGRLSASPGEGPRRKAVPPWSSRAKQTLILDF